MPLQIFVQSTVGTYSNFIQPISDNRFRVILNDLQLLLKSNNF
jgi:hypothetical protein